MFNRKQTRVVVTAVVLLTHLTFISMKCPVTHGATSQFQVAGRWQGKFPLPDDNSISEDDNPIAVEVTVKEESGKLSGVAVFYVIRNKDNKPQVVGKTEADLIDLQFDGTTLKFSVKRKGQQPGTSTKVEMRMKIISDTEAELENLEDNSGPVFKMKKIQ